MLNDKFLQLQENNSNQLLKFDFHILELQKIIRDKDLEIDTLKKDLNDNENKESKNSTEPSHKMSQLKQDESNCPSVQGGVRPRNKKKKKKQKTPN